PTFPRRISPPSTQPSPPPTARSWASTAAWPPRTPPARPTPTGSRDSSPCWASPPRPPRPGRPGSAPRSTWGWTRAAPAARSELGQAAPAHELLDQGLGGGAELLEGVG